MVLDLRTPSGDGPHRVALLIHGGFWREIWKRDLMDPMAVALTNLGWATVNIEYHRGHRSYAAAPSDIEIAVQWIRHNAGEHGLDPDRIVALGHSAGGYLALSLAHNDGGISGAVVLAGVSDLTATHKSHPDGDPVTRFLGRSRDDAPRLWDQAELNGRSAVPVHLVHGIDDDEVDPAQSEAYAALGGEISQVTLVDGCGHMELIDPSTAAWSEVTTALNAVGV
jgi:acetyl esterase/lipase